MLTMKFRKPEFHQGLNMTVRQGEKWYYDLNVGDTIELVRDKGNEGVFYRATVVNIFKCQFLNVPQRLLQYEHDPHCHDLYGLRETMKQVYEDFSDFDFVTCVLFWIEKC